MQLKERIHICKNVSIKMINIIQNKVEYKFKNNANFKM